jgi:hypothetical protein
MATAIHEHASFQLIEHYSVWRDFFRAHDCTVWAVSDLYQVLELHNLQSAFRTTPIRGILMVPLKYRQQWLGYLSIFRDEIETETLWAGEFDPDHRQVQPRSSFEVWKESKKGQAHQWTERDTQLATALANEFATAIQQYEMHQQLQLLNANLEQQVQERTAKLQQAAEQQQVLFEVVAKIRESLNLKTIFRTTSKEVRQALNADRVAIFCFDSTSYFSRGEFISEDVLPQLPSAIAAKIHDHCFGEQYADSYQKGRIQAIADIHHASLQDCHIQLLEQFQVRANLVVPLIQGDSLWGLLCVHQCRQPRMWEPSEIQFVTQVAAQLSVALQQGDLLIQTQQQAEQLSQAIQELKEAQTQLIQTEKMSSLGQLVAGIAHEINNPVNFIYGNITYARDYIEELLSLLHLYQKYYPEAHPEIMQRATEIEPEFLAQDLLRILNSMNVGADRIRQIIQSLLNFSRLDQAEIKPVDLHEGLDSTLLILQHRLKANSARPAIEVIKNYGNLPLVECYAGQLNQVFMNILGNAVDALEQLIEYPEKLTISITTEVLNCNRVAIHIADNGSGMSEAIRARVFDPFFTTKTVGKGTGLGLSISYQIVTEKHNGQLWFRSEPGRGAEFVIEIPIHLGKEGEDLV